MDKLSIAIFGILLLHSQSCRADSIVDSAHMPSFKEGVVIQAGFINPKTPIICGITNLPDGVALSVTVQKETGTTHAAGEKATVKNGQFCTIELIDYSVHLPLEPGYYKTSIFMLPPVSGEVGYDVIGNRGRNLKGEFISVMPAPEVPEGEVRAVDYRFVAKFGNDAEIIESNKVTIFPQRNSD